MPDDPRLLVGFDKADDAGVFRISDQMALIQTVDFFTPMVDDPYSFGQIAAANALSDVYAMGGKPLTAMNIVCFPECLDVGILREIIKGGLSKIEEAGAVLVGGHTIDDAEPKYGLSVTGVIDPQRVTTNHGAREEDCLYMTKSLGTGIIATAIKGEMADENQIAAVISSMTALNDRARDAMMEVGVNACTDVTGFGLLGHAMEMAEGSGVGIELWSDSLGFLPGAMELANMGLIPGGAYSNRDYLQDRVEVEEGLDLTCLDIMYSPETSGGLLISVDQMSSRRLEEEFVRQGVVFFKVGRVKGAKPGRIRVLRRE